MTILHVRNLPEKLYSRLEQRAEEHHRSLDAEVIALLEWALEEVDRTPAMTLSSMRRRRFFSPAAVGAPDSTELLRRDRGR
jgi:plasmid stability protein